MSRSRRAWRRRRRPSTRTSAARWMVDGLRLLLLDSPLRRRGLSCAPGCTTCTRPAPTCSACRCCCSSPCPRCTWCCGCPRPGGEHRRRTSHTRCPTSPSSSPSSHHSSASAGPSRAFRSAIFDAGITPIALIRAFRDPAGWCDEEGGAAPPDVAGVSSGGGLVLLIVALATAVTDDRAGLGHRRDLGDAAGVAARRAADGVVRTGAHGPAHERARAACRRCARDRCHRRSRDRLTRPVRGPAEGRSILCGGRTVRRAGARRSRSDDGCGGADRAAAVVLEAPTTIPTITTSTIAVGPSVLAVPADGAYFGVAHEGMHTTERGVEEWSRAHGGARPAIVHWFQQWGSGENRFREDWVRHVARRVPS